MPMTPEEQAAFDAAKAEAASVKAELEALKKNPPAPTKKDDDDPSVLAAARKKEQEDAERKATEKSIIEAAKFSVSIKDMVEKSGEFFPAEVKSILDINAQKPYESELERANDLRATLIESVFSQKKNLELLSDVAREKINDFLALSDKKKQEKAPDYWEYVLTALDTHNRIEKIERVNKNRSGIAGDGAQDAYDKKILGLRQPLKKEE